MIRNESEYQAAVTRIKQEQERFAEHARGLAASGMNAKEVKRVLDPLMSFHQQLVEEVDSYERLKRGEFAQLHNFDGFGRLLIGLRIFKGLTQRDLAERLNVHESQVSRDERNDYHGITVERAGRILEALGVTLNTSIDAQRKDGELVGA